jgi:hypothetical protein
VVLALTKGSTVFVNYLGAYMTSSPFSPTHRARAYVLILLQLPRMYYIQARFGGPGFVTDFMHTSAHDIAAQKQHKSVSASDVLKALEEVEMGDIIPKLQQDLQGMLYPICYL